MDFDVLNETITLQNTSLLTISGTGGISLPSGTTIQRPGVVSGGTIRWNSASAVIEFFNGSAWAPVGAGSVTSVGLSLPSIFTVSGSPVTASGILSATLASQTANTVLAGPTSSSAVPTFRTLGLSNNDLSDVLITTPSTNQVIAYNGTSWVNTGAVGSSANGNIGVSPTGGGTAWTFLSGVRYYADYVHNLGTTNFVITLYDTSSGAVINADSIIPTSNSTVRVTVVGNTRTIKVVVVANGQSIVAGGSTPSSVIVSQDGNIINTATTLNFTGSSVLKVTNAGAGTSTVSIGSRFTYFASSMDSPVNSDFAINSLAPAVVDPIYGSLTVRSFTNGTEQGVAFLVSVPTGASQLTLKIKGRAQAVPASASVVQPRLYYRLVPNNAAIGAWSAATELANIAIPTNSNFQYSQQTISLATLGLTAGNLYQFELTRRGSGVTGTDLTSPFLLVSVDVEIA